MAHQKLDVLVEGYVFVYQGAYTIRGIKEIQRKIREMGCAKRYHGKSGNFANARDNQGSIWKNVYLCFFDQLIF